MSLPLYFQDRGTAAKLPFSHRPKGLFRAILHQVRLIFSVHPGHRQRRAVFVPSRGDVCLFSKGHSFLREETFVPSRGDDSYAGAKYRREGR